jgi:cytochrome c
MRRMMITMAVAATAWMPGLATAQSGDAAAGQRVFNQCRACHTPDQGGRNGVGPNLWGIVGRNAASIEGFRYSANMRELATGGLVWNEDRLRAYITNPKAVVPTGSMSYPGLRNEEQLNNLIAYLNTLK